jgi:hypothetical protein
MVRWRGAADDAEDLAQQLGRECVNGDDLMGSHDVDFFFLLGEIEGWCGWLEAARVGEGEHRKQSVLIGRRGEMS